jgi:hypothetical protein
MPVYDTLHLVCLNFSPLPMDVKVLFERHSSLIKQFLRTHR